MDRFSTALADNSGFLMGMGGQLLAHRQNAMQPMFSPQGMLQGLQVDEARRERRETRETETRRATATQEWLTRQGIGAEDAQLLADAGLAAAFATELWKPKKDDRPNDVRMLDWLNQDPSRWEQLGKLKTVGHRTAASDLVQAIGPDGEPVFVRAEDAPGMTPFAQDRDTDLTRRERMLVESGVPPLVAKGLAAGRYVVSRHPINQTAQIVDKATGQIIFDGTQAEAAAGAMGQGMPMGAGAPMSPMQQQPMPAGGGIQGGQGAMGGSTFAPPGAGQPSYIPPGVDPLAPTGARGFLGNTINRITDAVGLGIPFQSIEESGESLTTVRTLTQMLLQEAVPGRPAVHIWQQLGGLTVEPNSLFRGEESAANRLKQTRTLIESEITRMEREVLGRPGEFTPQQITHTRVNLSELRQLLRAYDALVGAVEKRRGDRPPLEQFDRRRGGR